MPRYRQEDAFVGALSKVNDGGVHWIAGRDEAGRITA